MDIQCWAFADDFYFKLNMSSEERSVQERESADHAMKLFSTTDPTWCYDVNYCDSFLI